MDVVQAYSADRSLKGKLRRRLARLVERRPARLSLNRPMVSFSFDDVPATATGAGARTLEAHGVRGTYFISAGLAGREGPMGRYATRGEVLAVQAAGHEIACHTFSHLDCGSAPRGAIEADVERNHAALADWGAGEARNFAYPYGDVRQAAKAALGRRYSVLRALNPGLIEDGTDLNQTPAVGIEGPDGERTAQAWLARAIRRKAWLILYTHDVSDAPTVWGCTPDALGRLVGAAKAGGCDIVTVAEGAWRLAN
ncbi:MAG: polysaccharide deacetylase family protein [Caulobacteraceae bacterium]|nr:polysaccharide deacetylase family protein [Caulobacteraceae bacterium]